MTRLGVIALAAASTAAAAPGSRIELTLPDGRAGIEWITPAAFRFTRTWTKTLPKREPIPGDAVDVSRTEGSDRTQFRTRSLVLEVERSGAGLSVRSTKGKALVATRWIRRGASVSFEHSAADGERFYGLGRRSSPNLDIRGSVVKTGEAFMISSAGFGEYYPALGEYVFDLASANPALRTVSTPAREVDYFFYYGPGPKGILEEHLSARDAIAELKADDLAIRAPRSAGQPKAGWQALRDAVAELAHASLSGILFAEFDYSRFDPAVLPRAAQLASALPVVRGPALPEMARWRNRLIPFFVSYVQEARDRGFPIARAMYLQYSEDEQLRQRSDQLMIGDELLAAPVLTASPERTVYLPRGIWTRFRTNQVHKGRQEIKIRAEDDELPLFMRNGSIVPFAPLSRGGPFELHYYPSLAAELFLWEEEEREFSQFHAAPALDFMRLESESKKQREYEWIVHNIERPKTVEGVGRPLKADAWRYDAARRDLHVRVRGEAGGDEIVNIRW